MSVSDLECSEIWKQTPIRAEKSSNKLHSKQMFPAWKLFVRSLNKIRDEAETWDRTTALLMHNFLNTHFSGSKPAQLLFFPLLFVLPSRLLNEFEFVCEWSMALIFFLRVQKSTKNAERRQQASETAGYLSFLFVFLGFSSAFVPRRISLFSAMCNAICLNDLNTTLRFARHK